MDQAILIGAKTAIPLGFFFLVQKIVYTTVPLPDSIKEIKEPKERKKNQALYYSNYVSCFHSIVLIVFGGYFSLTRNSRDLFNSSDEELVIYVSFWRNLIELFFCVLG